MDQVRKEEIAGAIREQMDTRGFSQKRMAAWIGDISPAHLNFVLNNRWENVSAQMWTMLEARFIQRRWGIYETANFRAIQSICADTQRYSTSNCISDYTGAGKTVGMEEYSKRNANAFYVLSDQMMSTKDFAREMQAAIGISQEGTAREMVMAVVRELKKLDKPVLLIDEADKLNDRNLMLLKMVYDRLKTRCGFVTAGTEVLKERINKFAKRNKIGYREWKRRFAVYRKLHAFDTSKKAIREEIVAICLDQGIDNKSQISHILSTSTNYDDVRIKIQDFQRENQAPAQLEAELAEA